MNASEIERELEELETRIERLRALYEQYFMGLEKLEPLIARKDVDRRIWILRRVQVRNTGLRFKFQMLIQRYNTFQQYWVRVTREIENGTYRRDVVRAAKRFGAKDAMTILGRKRAQKYAELAAIQEAQAERKRKRETDFEELSDEDLLVEEDEYGELLSGDELLEDDEENFGPLGDDEVQGLLQSLSAEDEQVSDETTAPAPLFGRHSGFSPKDKLWIPPPPPVPSAVLSPSLSGPVRPFAARPPAPLDDDEDPMEATIEFRKPFPPPRPSDPEAAKRRLRELAAEMKSQTGMTLKEAGEKAGPLELDLDFDAPRATATRRSTKPPPKRASTTKMPAVKAGGAPASGRAGAPSTRRTTRTMRAVRPPSSPAPASERPKSRPPAARKKQELGDQRLQQIYNKYIETRRDTNEPVAGMTYEKVAESLKSQADKLRAMHPDKSVDYEVVVKNGKTLLKPILR